MKATLTWAILSIALLLAFSGCTQLPDGDNEELPQPPGLPDSDQEEETGNESTGTIPQPPPLPD